MGMRKLTYQDALAAIDSLSANVFHTVSGNAGRIAEVRVTMSCWSIVWVSQDGREVMRRIPRKLNLGEGEIDFPPSQLFEVAES